MSLRSNVVAPFEAISHQVPQHVEDPRFMIAAAATMLVGAGMTYVSRRGWKNAAQDELQILGYTDPDQADSINSQYIRHRRRNFVAWTTATLAVSSIFVDRAEPYNEEMVYHDDRVAVIIEAGQDSRAKDVELSEGANTQQISRIQAGLVGVSNLVEALDGNVTVDVILNGAHPESAGSMEELDDLSGVIDATSAYLQEFDNAGEPDLQSAIAVAEVNNPDRIVVLTQDSSQGTEDAIRENLDVDVLSTGKAGTELVFLGQEKTADFTSSFGKVTAEQATTTKEIDEFLEAAITNKVAEPEKKPIDIYKYVSLAFFGISWLVAGLQGLKFPRKLRGGKK